MPSPQSVVQVFDDLVSTTYRNHIEPRMVDNVTRHNALLKRLTERGKINSQDGGLSIAIPLEYAENGTYQRYSGYDILNVAASDTFTMAEYQWRQAAVNVVTSGREIRINSGDSRLINLAKARITNAVNTAKNNFSVDCYSDGTLPNQVNGLQALIADNGQGTVGGINAATWAFWRNRVQSAAAPLQGGGAIVPSATTIESLMLPLYIATTRGDDMVDLIVTSDDYFNFYEQSQVSIKRYASADMAQGGFLSLKYKKADVIFDGSSGIPASRMYFLNTNYLYLVQHSDARWSVDESRKPVNQDASVVPILWMGNLAASNRFLQGVLRP